MRLLWSPSKENLLSLISEARESVDLAVAYISPGMASELLDHLRDGVRLRVLTRLDGKDFRSGIAKVSTFRLLGRHLQVISNLHAKLYIVDEQMAVLGSANLTREGLLRNQEIGVLVDDPLLLREICQHFNSWWKQSAPVDYDALARRVRSLPKTHGDSSENERAISAMAPSALVDELSKKVAQLPRRPQGARKIERSISDLTKIRPALIRFPFKVGKAFLDRKQGHPITIPTAYRGRLEAKGLAPADNIVILCPDGSKMKGRILYCPPEKAGDYGSYYQIRVRGGYPGDAISRLNGEQRIAVEISRVNRTVQVHLRLVR